MASNSSSGSGQDPARIRVPAARSEYLLDGPSQELKLQGIRSASGPHGNAVALLSLPDMLSFSIGTGQTIRVRPLNYEAARIVKFLK